MRQIIRMFKDGNVCVCGERGTGKDMLFANVIARRNKPYISNCDYTPKSKKSKATREALVFKDLDMNGNTYKNLIDGNIKKWVYPYKHGADLYITDVGVYLPSQFCNELNRDYKGIPQFMGLSRQIGLGTNTHINTQSLNRCYDKIREQSRRYISCQRCKVLKLPFNQQLVFQRVRIYEKYQSCLDNVPPLRIPLYMMFGSDVMRVRLYKLNYQIQHGKIREKRLVYLNKSNYDTNIFKHMFEKGA